MGVEVGMLAPEAVATAFGQIASEAPMIVPAACVPSSRLISPVL